MTLVAISVAFSVGAAHAGLDGPGGCVPQNEQFVAGIADFNPLLASYKCSLVGQHGNYGTTAYTNVYYDAFNEVPIPCTTVGAQVTYSHNGVLFAAARSDATLHNWATSAPAGSNRYIVGSTFFATRPGYYDYPTTVGAIGC